MDVERMVDELAEQGAVLVQAARLAGPRAAVPSCPLWTVADLLKHVGEVHRWAAAIVDRAAADEVDSLSVIGPLPADEDLPGWVADGVGALVATLRAASPELACWHFMRGASPREFWARRQLHETSVHRMDAELAAGQAVSPVAAAVAEDGVDEMLVAFLQRRTSRLRSQRPRTLLVAPEDSPTRWLVTITEDQPVTVREERPADAVLRGPVGQLYPVLWNRMALQAADVTVEGDVDLMELWRDKVTVSWN